MSTKEDQDLQNRQYDRTLGALADLMGAVRDIHGGYTPRLAADIATFLREVKCEVEDLVILMEADERS
jgi:hypothetical protein